MGLTVTGKVVLLFGGGTAGDGVGNGRAAAIVLAREGARVAVADISREAADETVRIIREAGGDALALQADVFRSDEIAAAVRACAEHYGGVDVLINNVGVSSGVAGIVDHDEDLWDRVFAINLRSVLTAARHTIPIMLERGGGRIINVASTSGIRIMGRPITHAYAVSKAGVVHFTRTIALEYARQGIRCNCIVPGMLDTPHASSAYKRLLTLDPEEVKRRRHAASPTGALGTAWDFANAALYLASEEANYVNAETLVLDGGLVWSTPTW